MRYQTKSIRMLMARIRADHDNLLHVTADDFATGVASDLSRSSGEEAKLSSEGTPTMSAITHVIHDAPKNASDEDIEKITAAQQKMIQDLRNDEEVAERLKQIGLF